MECVRYVCMEGEPQDDNDWKQLNKHLYDNFPDINKSQIRTQNERELRILLQV